MTEHSFPCNQEKQITDIRIEVAELSKNREWMREDLKEIKGDLKKIVESISGNGKPGIVSRLTKNETDTSRQWWWLGGISLAAAAEAIRQLIKT